MYPAEYSGIDHLGLYAYVQIWEISTKYAFRNCLLFTWNISTFPNSVPPFSDVADYHKTYFKCKDSFYLFLNILREVRMIWTSSLLLSCVVHILKGFKRLLVEQLLGYYAIYFARSYCCHLRLRHRRCIAGSRKWPDSCQPLVICFFLSFARICELLAICYVRTFKMAWVLRIRKLVEHTI
jgi:hypothetical protein